MIRSLTRAARLALVVLVLGCNSERTITLTSDDGRSSATYGCATGKQKSLSGDSSSVVLGNLESVVGAKRRRGDTAGMAGLVRLLQAKDYKALERIIVEEKCSGDGSGGTVPPRRE